MRELSLVESSRDIQKYVKRADQVVIKSVHSGYLDEEIVWHQILKILGLRPCKIKREDVTFYYKDFIILFHHRKNTLSSFL